MPVTGLDRADEYQDAIRETLEERSAFGACLRVTNFDTDFPAPNISDLLGRLDLQAENADLLLDFGAVPVGGAGALGGLMYGYLESIPAIDRWRSLTVAATAFPERVSGLEKDTISRVPRAEWKAWLSLQNRSMRRRPQFGDYGIQHPQLVKFDGKKMRVSIHLRYTADSYWLVARGSGRDYGAMHGLCANLMQQPEYSSSGHCWGDQWIADCAARVSGPGNPNLWRKVGTSHHLTFVVDQIASLAGT